MCKVVIYGVFSEAKMGEEKKIEIIMQNNL